MNMLSRLALLIALGLITSSQADELGRLFFSPEERRQLDHKFAAGKDGANEQSAIIVNGLIQRSDGSRTVWINGKVKSDVPGKSPNTALITPPGKHKPIEVKVGQRLQLDKLPGDSGPQTPKMGD